MAPSAVRKPGASRKRRAATRKRATTRNRRAAASRAPSVIPMISYEDGVAALEWLARAFGFRETVRLLGPDGRLSHGEMKAGTGLIMLASPTPDYQSPKRHREICEAARKWSSVAWIIDGVLVYVDDLDAHFRRAKAAGARILSEIEEGPPGRRYRAEDLEGHRWFFFQREGK
jgi:uncharacterized glyoxalase superfamily protein PhnB